MSSAIGNDPILKQLQQVALTARNLAALKTAAADTNSSLQSFGTKQTRPQPILSPMSIVLSR